jgi:hypothetical protein
MGSKGLTQWTSEFVRECSEIAPVDKPPCDMMAILSHFFMYSTKCRRPFLPIKSQLLFKHVLHKSPPPPTTLLISTLAFPLKYVEEDFVRFIEPSCCMERNHACSTHVQLSRPWQREIGSTIARGGLSVANPPATYYFFLKKKPTLLWRGSSPVTLFLGMGYFANSVYCRLRGERWQIMLTTHI